MMNFVSSTVRSNSPGWGGFVLLVAPFVCVSAAHAQFAFPSAGGNASSANFAAEVTVGETSGHSAGAGFSAAAGMHLLFQGAPSGTLSELTAAAGANFDVSAILTDDVRVTSALLHFRPGGSAAFSSVAMTLADSVAGRWTATIPATDVSVRGIQYYVEASDGVNVTTIPSTVATGRFANVTVQVTNQPAFSIPAARYLLGGIAFQPANANPAAVFSSLGDYDTSRWRFGTFNPSTSGYLELGQGAANVNPGQGFWIYSTEAAAIAVTGSSVDLSDDVVLTLSPGFNQIGNPFAFPVAFGDVVRPAEVENALFGWNGESYVPASVLAPGAGYWIRNNDTAPKQIRIPPVGAGTTGRSEANPMRPLQEDPNAWSVVVHSEMGRHSDLDLRFGMHPSATALKDEGDIADPPSPPGGFANLYFLGGDGIPLVSDWRARNESGERWDLHLRTDLAGETYTVRFAVERPLPEGWKLAAIPEDGGIIDLTSGEVLTGTASSTTTTRTWVIVAGPDQFVEEVGHEVRTTFDAAVTQFAFTAPAPHPVRLGQASTFQLQIPAATDATVQVFDVTGRRVVTLLDRRLERGVHDLSWNGRTEGGRAAAGVYFVEARAGASVQHHKLVVLR